MEAFDFVVLAAGGWLALVALAMTLLTAASRADQSSHETVTAAEPESFDRTAPRTKLPRLSGANRPAFASARPELVPTRR
jgi:hypothetical protein